MTTEQIITPDDGSDVDPHPHDASEISGEATLITLRVNRLLAGTISGKEIIIAGGTDGIIRSEGFVSGSTGWRGLGDGTWELNNAIIRGSLINLPSGTSFPGSPSDGDLFYRTDTNRSFRFDGTDWHSIDFLEDSDRVGGSVIATAAIQNLAVTNAKIDDLAVSSTKIVDAAITNAKIDNLAVDTAQIAAAAITNAKINDLSADKINAGTLNADRIGTGTLTAEKLILGSSDNLIQNPGFETGAVDPHVSSGGGGTWSVGSVSRSGGFALNYDSTGQSSLAIRTLNGAATDINSHPSAGEGDVFYFSFYGERSGSGAGNDLVAAISFREEGGTQVGVAKASITPTTSYQIVEVEATAPAGTAYVAFQIRVQNGGNTPTGGHNFDDLYARRKVGTLVIEDQAVDIARMLNPVHSEIQSDTFSNLSLTTTEQDGASHTFTIPSWVGTLDVGIVSDAQISNSSGGDQGVTTKNEIDGTSLGEGNSSVSDGNIGQAVKASGRSITSPGSSIVAKQLVAVTTGTNSSNSGRASAWVVGVR